MNFWFGLKTFTKKFWMNDDCEFATTLSPNYNCILPFPLQIPDLNNIRMNGTIAVLGRHC